MNLQERDERAPPLRLLVGELGVAADWARARLRPVAFDVPATGDGAPVMTLPGFCAGDVSMAQFRRTLNAAGYRAKRWKQGANLGARADTIDRLHHRVAQIMDDTGQKVHLVGWSLGGIFAREYAKRHPDAVASVITMGSPFSGSRRANHAWRVYRLIAGHSVDAPPIDFDPQAKPPVPTFALWSPVDGVVAPASARGDTDERDVAIEVQCRHLGFAYAPAAIEAVLACLRQSAR